MSSRSKRIEAHAENDTETAQGYRATMWLRTEDRDQVRWLTLDRAERKNAITSEGWDDLRGAFEDFETSPARVLVITGAGGAFCSGADLDPSARPETGVVAHRRRLARVGSAALALHRVTKPTVALVDGIAAGAGMNLALGCDLVLATSRARFSEIFVARGLTLDFGGSWLLPRIVGIQRAKELALTGRIVEAEEAVLIGLALEIVDGPERVDQITALLAAGAPVAQMLTKQNLNRAYALDLNQALAQEGQAQAICLSSEDFVEGVTSFLEKRPPRFSGN